MPRVTHCLYIQSQYYVLHFTKFELKQAKGISSIFMSCSPKYFYYSYCTCSFSNGDLFLNVQLGSITSDFSYHYKTLQLLFAIFWTSPNILFYGATGTHASSVKYPLTFSMYYTLFLHKLIPSHYSIYFVHYLILVTRLANYLTIIGMSGNITSQKGSPTTTPITPLAKSTFIHRERN